jgi:hypothetical protein
VHKTCTICNVNKSIEHFLDNAKKYLTKGSKNESNVLSLVK